MSINRITTIKKFLNEDECLQILNCYADDSQLKDAEVYNSFNILKTKEARKSKVSFIDDIDKIGEKIINEVKNHINPVKGYTPSLNYFQFTKYDVGDYFNWHSDSDDTTFKDRFYTIVVQLNNDYEGGEFQLLIDKNEITLERGVGNLFIFPSEIVHRVKPITKNIRYSLVNWLKLNPLENIKKTLI